MQTYIYNMHAYTMLHKGLGALTQTDCPGRYALESKL